MPSLHTHMMKTEGARIRPAGRDRMRLEYWTIDMIEYMIHLKEAVLMKHGTVYNEYTSVPTEKE